MIDIAADDPPRAIRFYERVFGWRIRKWEGPTDYWLIQTGDVSAPGINAGLAKRDNPSQFVTPFISVPSVDEYAARVQASGGTIIQPKMAIPGIGYLAAFRDTEGNTVGMLEKDEAVR
jgi:hypothetical protein